MEPSRELSSSLPSADLYSTVQAVAAEVKGSVETRGSAQDAIEVRESAVVGVDGAVFSCQI